MKELNDLQCILLSTAARRTDGCLWPLPDSVSEPAPVEKAVSALLKNGLIDEEPRGKDQGGTGRDQHLLQPSRTRAPFTGRSIAETGIPLWIHQEARLLAVGQLPFQSS